MNTKQLDKVLRSHFQYCKMHEFSLQKERRCSCGIEGARSEKEQLLKELDNAFRVRESFVVVLCEILEIPYEDADLPDVLKRVRLAAEGVSLVKKIDSWLDRHVNLSANSFAQNEIKRFVKEWNEKPS